MIHLFRLLMLNISSATNSEKIRIAKENKLHDSSEIKLIFIGIIVFVLSYLVYWVTNSFLLDMKYNILIISYIIASVMVLIDNLNNIKSVLIYKSEDDYLFSLPLTSTEIILSKLFLTYLKNLIYIFIIMFPTYIAIKNVINITSTGELVYLLAAISIPLIPIIIGTSYSFIDSYYSSKKNNKKYNIIRILLILFIFIILFLLLNKTNTINEIIKRLSLINPFIYLFKLSIINNNIIAIILLLILPILLFILFIKHLSVNYNYILSRIRGAKISKEKEIVIKKKKSKLNSIISKEIQTIINNKVYFKSTIKTSILLTIFFFLVSLIIDTKKISEAHNFGVYLMFFVSFIAASSCTTINSLSLEKKCILQLKTMPVSFIKVLIAKYLTNIIISLPVIIINFIISALFYDIDKVTLLMLFINPLLLTSFISLLGLILDFRFIDFTEKDSNNIIKNRIITYIPPLANLLIISILFLINPIDKYYLLLLAFSCIILFVMILMLFYLLISYKKILNANIK